MRDYVYGISNDPVRAAVTTELAATGVGQLFGPGTPTTVAIAYIQEWFAAREIS